MTPTFYLQLPTSYRSSPALAPLSRSPFRQSSSPPPTDLAMPSKSSCPRSSLWGASRQSATTRRWSSIRPGLSSCTLPDRAPHPCASPPPPDVSPSFPQVDDLLTSPLLFTPHDSRTDGRPHALMCLRGSHTGTLSYSEPHSCCAVATERRRRPCRWTQISTNLSPPPHPSPNPMSPEYYSPIPSPGDALAPVPN